MFLGIRRNGWNLLIIDSRFYSAKFGNRIRNPVFYVIFSQLFGKVFKEIKTIACSKYQQNTTVSYQKPTVIVMIGELVEIVSTGTKKTKHMKPMVYINPRFIQDLKNYNVHEIVISTADVGEKLVISN